MDPIVSDPRVFIVRIPESVVHKIWACRRHSWSGQCSLPQFAPFRLSESCRCSDLWCAKLLCLSHWLACPYQDHFVLQYEEPVAGSRFPSHVHAPEHIPGWTAAWDHWGSKMNFPAGFAHTRGLPPLMGGSTTCSDFRIRPLRPTLLTTSVLNQIVCRNFM